jgi:hypothetical protein
MATDARHHPDATCARGAAPSRSFARSWRWSLLLAFVCFPVPASALLINMTFESVAGAVPLTGAGTHTATLNLGSVSAFEPLNAGVTRTVGASNYTISTRFGVRGTHLLSLLSPSYTLTGRLLGGSPITWQLDGVTMSTSAATIATSQPYGPVIAHTVAFIVPFSRPAGVVSTVFEVTAIAN